MTDRVTSPPADHAGVWMPPPLIYVVIYGLGALLAWVWPLALPESWPVRGAALLFLGAGVLLAAWSNLLFRRERTSLVPVRPSAALVIRGPYRFTRNPMYLSLTCIYLAAALWFGLAWALILTPLLVLAVQHLAIVKEERYLERRFGDAYRAYRAQVRRWL